MKIQVMEPLTKSILFSSICLLAFFFNLYAMNKNAKVVTNKFLFLKGFVLSTALLCLALPDVANIAVNIGIISASFNFEVEVETFYHPYVVCMVVGSSLLHAGYLFSLRNRCWRYENILYSIKKKISNFIHSEHSSTIRAKNKHV